MNGNKRQRRIKEPNGAESRTNILMNLLQARRQPVGSRLSWNHDLDTAEKLNDFPSVETTRGFHVRETLGVPRGYYLTSAEWNTSENPSARNKQAENVHRLRAPLQLVGAS